MENDITYNFLVGEDGNVYEGRGYNVGNHSFEEYNDKSICISFIGNYVERDAPEIQILAAQRFIEDNVKTGQIGDDYTLYGHRQVRQTQSPGECLFNQIKNWEHWEPTI